MNITSPTAVRSCTSCQMCSAVCPCGAISIRLDSEGFYRPDVDSGKCVNCGLCADVCYKFDRNICMTDLQAQQSCKLYAAAALDEHVLGHTTSGGIADLLAKSLVENGYLCVGVTYDAEQAIAKNVIAKTPEETDKFRGSKYIQSYSETAFRQIVERHKDSKIAVFGTPCQIYAIDRFARARGVRDNFLLIDLYCHGCPTLNLWKKYEREVLRFMKGDAIVSADFRSKIKGWGNGLYVVVIAVSGHSVPFVSSPEKDEFYTLFFSDNVLNEACSDCMLRSTFAYTDIRLGDFWGRCYLQNTTGMSGVSLVSERGEAAFAQIESEIWKQEHSHDDFIPFQSFGKSYHVDPNLRRKLLAELSNPDVTLKTSIKTIYAHQSVGQRINRIVKKFIMLLPVRCVQSLRAFYYKLR